MSLRRIANRLLNGPSLERSQSCYGQNGEDLVLDRLLDGQSAGFFVDIGAHHPMRFSNTYLFYRRGWRGINVDAEPGSMRRFNRLRPRDINIEAGVGAKAGTSTYFRFNDPALNTFDPEEAARKDAEPYRIVERLEVPIRRLDDILAAHLPSGRTIDFLSIDVEGLEGDVLRSNDWSRFRPRLVLAEILRTPILQLGDNEVVRWLRSAGYEPITQAFNTTFFSDTTGSSST